MRGARATVTAVVLTALLCARVATGADPAPQSTTGTSLPPPPPVQGYDRFPLEEKIEDRVRFWVDVYAKYHTYETLIVDVRHPNIIFATVDTKEHPGVIVAEKRKVAAAIRVVADKWDALVSGKLKRTSLRPTELRVFEAFERAKLPAELKAAAADPAGSLRAQNGLRDALEDALFASGKYLPRMEALFARFGLPPEIAYLPFVESGFNKHAVSKVGASGIWQFMPYTGKLYLRVDDVVDERNDPMRAAEAAAV